MNVTISESAKPDKDKLLPATKQLENILGKSAATVTAEWARGQDQKGRTVFALKLSDFTGQVSGEFAPDELHSERHLRFRLRDLWGDLLQIRSHKQLEKLMEGNGQAGEANGA